MNIDVLYEILLHLPVRSLLRFIGVHKSWYYIINSPHFRKLYTLRRNNNKDDEVYLCFISDFSRPQISLNLLDNGKSLMWYYFQCNDQRKFKYASVSVSGAVKGLVCISSPYVLGLAISNPFLGQLKNLPLSLCASTIGQNFYAHHVGLGFDKDYKVVQLLCSLRNYLHANLYSSRTNSWRELDCDQDLIIQKPIKSVCKSGSFAHWEGLTRTERKKIIISFDMKNEVFRTIKISGTGDKVLDNYVRPFKDFTIFAKGECSFVILVMDEYKLKVYESSGEGSEVIWNNMNNVSLYYFWKCNFGWTYDIPFWRNNNCVVLKGRRSREVLLYDYRARKIIKCFQMCGRWATGDEIMEYKIIEYEGSLISP